MIEKMKNVYIVAQASDRNEMLDSLRELGILHISQLCEPDEEISKRLAMISRLSTLLKEYAPKNNQDAQSLTDEDFEKLYNETVLAVERKNGLRERRGECQLNADKIRAWGNFDPESVRQLEEAGLKFRFYRIGKRELALLEKDGNARFIKLAPVEKMNAVAVLGGLGDAFAASEFALPEKSLAQLEAEISECDRELQKCDEILKNSAKYLKSYSEQLIKAQNRAEYSAVGNTLEESDGLVWLHGYIPAPETENFITAAKQNGWAWCIDDAKESDENVPTKIRYNKLTSLVQPVFELLGTVPGYGEYDISFWFLSFFTLFFAMIIGDAGYGVIFLLAAVIITVKMKKLNNATLLLYVLSIGTVVWGALTGTWFGLEKAMDVPFFKAMVIPAISNYPEYFGISATAAQNNVMKFCFGIGAIQLALACIMNVRRKIAKKNLSFIADIGWLAAICALYFTVLYLVIAQPVNIPVIAVCVGIGFLLVVLFGGMSPDKTFAEGLKSGLADTFTTFLNTISTFGNIMSYIRLFAVGMASLAIAQSFNDMASGFDGALLIVGAAIMILGHVLNIIMGFLSVVVHGVRLNLLEFSGQLGMEWSGTAYEPFCKREKIKK